MQGINKAAKAKKSRSADCGELLAQVQLDMLGTGQIRLKAADKIRDGHCIFQIAAAETKTLNELLDNFHIPLVSLTPK